MTRVIVHLDADAFFASVEQAADPRLRGKPVAVGGEKRGVVMSASYEARKFGVYTPMPTARARKLCPKLIVLPGDFERYEQFSRTMFSYAYDFTPDVEQTSIDEGYFDLSGTRKAPVEIAQTIRRAIAQSLKITVSEGIGANKLVSQIASKLTKPAAFAEVPAGHEIPFLHPLPNRWLPGVGPKTAARLDSAGLAQIRHISATPLELLELLLGRPAAALKQFAAGIDDRPVVPLREPAKSFSEQETFPADLTDVEYLEAVLCRMADRLFAKVREEDRSIRTLTVKVRYNDMAEDQCSESLTEPTDLETDVYSRLRVLLRQAWKRRVSLRLVSLKLANVYDDRSRSELPLDADAGRREARARLAAALDALRQSWGDAVLLRGHDLRLRDAPREAAAGADNRPEDGRARAQIFVRSPTLNYVPLRCHSHYSFLDATLSPAAIVQLAARHGLPAVALTDTGNLHGVVEFVQAAQAAGVKPIIGAEVRVGGHPLLLYAANATGYGNLCRLLSRHAEETTETAVAAKQRQPLPRTFLADHSDGLLAVSSDAALADFFPGRFYQAVTGREGAVACPAVHYATPDDRRRYDILQSIRTRTLLDHAHPDKRRGGRYHFRAPAELAAACAGHSDWLRATREIAERCDFAFPFGPPQFPAFPTPDGSPANGFLRRRVLDGLRRRYAGRRIVSDTGAEVPFARVQAQVEEELEIITAVGYEDYFLITWDFLEKCRRRGIEWITRGSAADSLVCYCLGVSSVCPIRFGLYFRRFLNRERMALHKLPDIDIDFAHDVKDDVVQLLFAQYGREHCAVVGGFSTFQARSAFAEAAKVLGLGERDVRKFTEHFPWGFGGGWVPDGPAPQGGEGLIQLLRAGPETRDLPFEAEPYRTALLMAEFLDGMPRCPKMHPCGLVLSRQPMHDLTPTFLATKGYPTAHFDMDAVEAVGLVKMDLLAQGGLAVMRDVKASLERQGIALDLERGVARHAASGQRLLGDPQAPEPWRDPTVWEMIAGGGARAVHHIESPAMTSLCRMCNVREIDGLIAIVSVIRPGAANEGKKRAFTRRYQGLEPVTGPHPSLAACLRSTYGLVVYEEHILQLCEAFASLPAGRADVLRRALNKQQRAVIEEIRAEFFAAAQARGHAPDTIAEVWGLVTGFAGYAFCKAHSTAYGVEAYQSAWLKRHFPAQFMAAVLTNGKGFYHPLVYVLECHRLGLRLLPPTVNQPGPQFIVEENFPLNRGPSAADLRAAEARRAGRADRVCSLSSAASGGEGRGEEASFAAGSTESLLSRLRTPQDYEPEGVGAGATASWSAAVLRRFARDPAGGEPPPLRLARCGGPPPLCQKTQPHPKAPGDWRTPKPDGCSDGSWETPTVPRPCLETMNRASRPFVVPPSGGSTLLRVETTRAPREGSWEAIRVPLTHLKGLTEQTRDRLLAEHPRGRFSSMADFYRRVTPTPEELEAMIRVGAFDEFGKTRTAQFWDAQFLLRSYGKADANGQGWLRLPAGPERLPEVPLCEPTRHQRLEWETELLGFAASGHPLELFDDVAWDTYCAVAELGRHVGQEIVTCGLVVEQRTHHQITGEPMKFLSLADWTGIVETELFAPTYRSYGLATVRYPVLEITATVEPFENGRGFSLRVRRAGKPRLASQRGAA